MKTPLDMQDLVSIVREKSGWHWYTVSATALANILEILESYYQEYSWDIANEKVAWISQFVDTISDMEEELKS